jgi:hypothetical protein
LESLSLEHHVDPDTLIEEPGSHARRAMRDTGKPSRRRFNIRESWRPALRDA